MPIAVRSATQLRKTLSATLRMAQRRDVVITVRSTPTAILRRFSREELEAALLVQSPSVRRRIERAFAEIAQGRSTVSLTALMREFEKRD